MATVIMQVKMVFGEVLEKDEEGSENCSFMTSCECFHGFSCIQNIYCWLLAIVVPAEPTSSVTDKTNYETFLLATKDFEKNRWVEGRWRWSSVPLI